MFLNISLQPKTILDPWYGEQFFVLGMFIDGFGVTARGPIGFPSTLKDSSLGPCKSWCWFLKVEAIFRDQKWLTMATNLSFYRPQDK